MNNDGSVHITFINKATSSYTADNIYILSISYEKNQELSDSEKFFINSDDNLYSITLPGFNKNDKKYYNISHNYNIIKSKKNNIILEIKCSLQCPI